MSAPLAVVAMLIVAVLFLAFIWFAIDQLSNKDRDQ